MKNVIIVLIFSLLCLEIHTQTVPDIQTKDKGLIASENNQGINSSDNVNDTIKTNVSNSITPLDSVSKLSVSLLDKMVSLEIDKRIANRYKIYPTENIYNLLKLDTQTGKIDQIQWSLDDNKEFIQPLNRSDLSWIDNLNSFELYPTPNMYQFILLDKATGRTWHVQWGLSDQKRWIRRIY